VRAGTLLASLAVCVALTALVAVLLDWSFERAVLAAPVAVLVAGAVGFLLVLWTRMIMDSFRRDRR
jgi:hypothetical protein